MNNLSVIFGDYYSCGARKIFIASQRVSHNVTGTTPNYSHNLD